MGAPLNGILEVAGPQQFRFDEFIQTGLRASHDPREVVGDSHAPYFGTEVGERALVPDANARFGEIRFEDWLAQSAVPPYPPHGPEERNMRIANIPMAGLVAVLLCAAAGRLTTQQLRSRS